MKYGNCQERDGDRGMRHEKNRNEVRGTRKKTKDVAGSELGEKHEAGTK
jgi:hypothetical protein